MEFLALIVGLVGLWLGTEAVIRGAVAIAARLHISEFIVGVAILSIGSDLPELTIAVRAALKNLQMGQVSDTAEENCLSAWRNATCFPGSAWALRSRRSCDTNRGSLADHRVRHLPCIPRDGCYVYETA